MPRIDLVKKYSYLIGQTINKWTILDVEKHNGRAYAICQCECGIVKPVVVINLLRNLSRDCGCGRKAMLRVTRTKNLVGQRFGKLVAIELLDESNKFNRRLYRCKCDCGNEVVVPSGSLTTSHTNSCGCLNSYHNMQIHRFLEANGIVHQTEYGVRIGERYYRFDFYLPEYDLLIEYDGQQHFAPARFAGNDDEANLMSFHKIQEYDEIKNTYCMDNNISLLRIPYWESKNIETIISNHLQRLSEKGTVA